MVAGEGTVSFLHMQARLAAERRFVGTPESRKSRHVVLAKLFTSLSEEAAFEAGVLADPSQETSREIPGRSFPQEDERYARLLRKKTFHQRHADEHLDVLVAARVRPPTNAKAKEETSVVACYGRQAVPNLQPSLP